MTERRAAGLHPTPAFAIPAMRRRLSPLVTAAAVAIILSCLTATALMTGMLPALTHKVEVTRPPVSRTGREILPVLPLSAASAGPDASARAGLAGQPGAVQQPDSRLEAADAIAMVPRSVTVPTATTSAALKMGGTPSDTPSTVAGSAMPHSRHSRHSRPIRPPAANQRQHRAGGPTQSKTREEVMAELLRAKRDGSYSSAMETYR